MATAVQIERVTHHYGTRRALDGLSLTMERGELFALLGPNGGGKTTLFRLLSTLIPPQQGTLSILGYDVAREPDAVRRRIGVVFQSPSLDRKLGVRENIVHQGHLYGLSGDELHHRVEAALARFGLADRAKDRVETLSGGLRRRVELAKGLLHRPSVLLLDEPSTGLDPGVRSDLWKHLVQLRDEDGVTVILTTHLLEEADKADRIAILDRGRLVALGPPGELRSSVGGDAIVIETDQPEPLAAEIQDRLALSATVVDGTVRLHEREGHRLIPRIAETFPGRIRSLTVGQPTLEDVFIAKTGHRFREADEPPPAKGAKHG